jgi:hypothetical protein
MKEAINREKHERTTTKGKHGENTDRIQGLVAR